MPLCRCILLKFYIKPQLVSSLFVLGAGCILLKFYIKPQLRLERELAYCVVSYRNSTSNHNAVAGRHYLALLYLIEILHQTTTLVECVEITSELYLIEILHQTTTRSYLSIPVVCCILSKFYIKPQLQRAVDNNRYVVSYRNSTSNHNHMTIVLYFYGLYLIEILHQTTTPALASMPLCRCILLKFYIKPQLVSSLFVLGAGCILLKFYIKPQLRLERELAYCVVSYRNSTSNHNYRGFIPILLYVVSYRNSTSNHNCSLFSLSRLCVVSYRNSTSNHNFAKAYFLRIKLYLIEILHQTTTRYPRLFKLSSCILSKFYIKPQPALVGTSGTSSCILSKFYIKPQL